MPLAKILVKGTEPKIHESSRIAGGFAANRSIAITLKQRPIDTAKPHHGAKSGRELVD